jgi:hypothetical protein
MNGLAEKYYALKRGALTRQRVRKNGCGIYKKNI